MKETNISFLFFNNKLQIGRPSVVMGVLIYCIILVKKTCSPIHFILYLFCVLRKTFYTKTMFVFLLLLQKYPTSKFMKRKRELSF